MNPHCIGWVAASVLLVLFASATSAQDARNDRAAFMRQARWGIMTHYLADWIARREDVNNGRMTVPRWNELVDGFDVEALARHVESAGAGYYLLSIGQNSGFYLSPNATYDKLVGNNPSKCSRRDLVHDAFEPLNRRGIKLMVYLPSGAPNGDRPAREALQWQNGSFRNREFQNKWESVIREWSARWGTRVSGWWFDGCYWPNTMYRTDEEPNFRSFAAAARAGNPNSALAFCPGVVNRTISVTPHEDYIAGEVSQLERWDLRRNSGHLVDGAQLHVLSYLGERWGGGNPRFTTEQAVEFSKKVAAAGGAITWDVPTRNDGTFEPQFIEQLAAIGKGMREIPTTQGP
jgi:alpha-L-fucosidase